MTRKVPGAKVRVLATVTSWGAMWEDLSEGLSDHENVQDIVFNNRVRPHIFYIATQGRGFWMRTLH